MAILFIKQQVYPITWQYNIFKIVFLKNMSDIHLS